jgi:hypothetical protein
LIQLELNRLQVTRVVLKIFQMINGIIASHPPTNFLFVIAEKFNKSCSPTAAAYYRDIV